MATLKELGLHFSNTYGERNAIFLPGGLGERLDLLSLSVSDLQDVVRRGQRDDLYAIALARLVSRVFCVVDHFHGGLPLVWAMMDKFPAAGCSYCHHRPCQCGEQRPEATSLASDETQATWSLGQWTLHLDELYGDRNRHKGMDYVIGRLFREVEEFRSIILRIQRTTSSRHDILRNCALELADILSWVMSASNVLGIDLERMVTDRYAHGCTSCRKSPCTCAHFARQQIDWEPLLKFSSVTITLSSQDLPRAD